MSHPYGSSPTLGLGFKCSRCGKSFPSYRQLSGHTTGKHLRRLGLKNAHITTGDLSDIQKGYLAAFIDGEGGIQITRSRRPNREYSLALHPTVYFTNTNRKVIDTLKAWLRCGCITTKRSKVYERPTYALSITGTRNVLALLDTLRPYFIIKQRQADLLIAFCNSRLSHYRSGDRRFNRREVQIYTKLKRLNKKGGKNRSNARIADEGG